MELVNALGQPVGEPLPDWTPPPRPPRDPMVGLYCRVEPLDAERHAEDLYEANLLEAENRMWTYLPYGPFDSLEAYREWMTAMCRKDDPLFHAIIDPATEKAVGVASYLRIDPANGCIEVGHLAYSPLLQRTRAATEAMFMMMARAFELGYRRYEWKCDSLNAPSRAAAQRLGFTFEGIFRQAVVYNGRNRDTAWYSIIDKEWNDLRKAYLIWLDPANFDGEGRQRASLSTLTNNVLKRHREEEPLPQPLLDAGRGANENT